MDHSIIRGGEKSEIDHITNLINYISKRSGTELSDISSVYRDSGPLGKLIEKELVFHPELTRSREYLAYLIDPTAQRALEVMKVLTKKTRNLLPDPTTVVSPNALPYRVGLFSDDYFPVSLFSMIREIRKDPPVVFHVILGTERENAERYQLNNSERWKNLIRSEVPLISRCFNIDLSELCWYGSFHVKDTVKDQPHVHLIIFSRDGREGRFSDAGKRTLLEKMERDVLLSSPKNAYLQTAKSVAMVRRKMLRTGAKNELKKVGEEEFQPTAQMMKIFRELIVGKEQILKRERSFRDFYLTRGRELYRLFTKLPSVRQLYACWIRWRQENPTGTELSFVPHAPLHVRQDLYLIQKAFFRMLEDDLPHLSNEKDIEDAAGDLYRMICQELTRPMNLKLKLPGLQRRFFPEKALKVSVEDEHEELELEMPDQSEREETREALEALSGTVLGNLDL